MDAVDQILNYTFKGGEVVFRITGAAAKNLAVLIAAMLKDSYRTSGKTRMARFYREGKDQKVITIPRDNLQKFNDLAKRYGILYCVIDDKRSVDLDLVIKTEDVAKVKRIYDRLEWGEMTKVADIEAVKNPGEIGKDANVITIEEPYLTPLEQELVDMYYKRDDLAAEAGRIKMNEELLKESGYEPDRFPQAEIEGMRNQIAEAEAALQEKFGVDAKGADKEIQVLDAKIEAVRKEIRGKNPTKEPDRSSIGSNGSHHRNNQQAPAARKSVKQKLDEIVQRIKQPSKGQKQKARAKIKAPAQEQHL